MGDKNYKEEAKKFCNQVDEFSKGKIQKSEDLNRIVEVIFKEDNLEMLEELSFTAKYSQGLMTIFQTRSNDIEEDYFEKIKNEYAESIKKIRYNLEVVINQSSSFIQGIFKEKYLGMTHESMSNLKILIEDLSWIKMYLNDKKRKDQAD